MIFIFIIFIFINIIFNFDNLMGNIYTSLFIWFYNVYPSIFIFYNISYYLITNNFFIKISNILKYLIKFDSDKAYSILLINIFLGNPGTTNLIEQAHNNNEISYSDYQKLLDITIFMNPLFVLNFLNIKYYFIYLITILIFIKLFSLFNLYKKDSIFINNINDTNLKKYSFIDFSISINNVINILLTIACMITFFSIIKTTIIFLFRILKINNNYIPLVLSYLEVASGLNDIKQYNLYYIISLIYFQGLCIIFQSYQYINKKNISFKRYIFSKLLSCFICTLIFIVLTFIFDKLLLPHFLLHNF